MARSIEEVSQAIDQSEVEQGPDAASLKWGVLAWADGRLVRYRERDGWAVTGGDIRLGPAGEALVVQLEGGPSVTIFGGTVEDGQIVSVESRLWPFPIPYTFEEALEGQITPAVEAWNALVAAPTLVPWSGEDYSLHFVRVGGIDGNWSEVGCARKLAQEVWIVDSAPERIVLHEIGHAAGLLHEHNRFNRNDHITVLWDHIPQNKKEGFLRDPEPGIALPSYDLDSVMHYRPWDQYNHLGSIFEVTAFGLDQYQQIHGAGMQPFGWETLSAADLVKISALYP